MHFDSSLLQPKSSDAALVKKALHLVAAGVLQEPGTCLQVDRSIRVESILCCTCTYWENHGGY